MKKRSSIVLLLPLVLLLAGCTGTMHSLQPTKATYVENGWKSFDEVRKAVQEDLVKGKTTFDDLQNTRFNPETVPNTIYLSNIDIRTLFMASGEGHGGSLEAVPPHIKNCLAEADGTQCHGIQFGQDNALSIGKGSLVKRFVGIENNNQITGWFYRLILIFQGNIFIDDRLSGQPNKNYHENARDVTALGQKAIGVGIGTGLKFIP